jgi:hypothetical protein
MPKTKLTTAHRAPRDYRIAAGFTEADVAGFPNREKRVDIDTLRKVERGDDVTTRVLDRLARLFKAPRREYAAAYYAVREARGS